jgi:hypothetical protein
MDKQTGGRLTSRFAADGKAHMRQTDKQADRETGRKLRMRGRDRYVMFLT